MSQKTRLCLVSCSVLRKEIEKLVQQGELDAEFVFVSKYFHVDYAQIEENLRPVIEGALQRFPGGVILVYGDLCLGMDNEMKRLAEQYGIVKVDALNCIDCLLGGKGKFLEADPNHDLMFLTLGMTDFFSHAKDVMLKEGVEETAVKQLFKGLRGIILLDTLGNVAQLRAEVERLDTGFEILETRHVGCENVKNVIREAIEKNSRLWKRDLCHCSSLKVSRFPSRYSLSRSGIIAPTAARITKIGFPVKTATIMALNTTCVVRFKCHHVR